MQKGLPLLARALTVFSVSVCVWSVWVSSEAHFSSSGRRLLFIAGAVFVGGWLLVGSTAHALEKQTKNPVTKFLLASVLVGALLEGLVAWSSAYALAGGLGALRVGVFAVVASIGSVAHGTVSQWRPDKTAYRALLASMTMASGSAVSVAYAAERASVKEIFPFAEAARWIGLAESLPVDGGAIGATVAAILVVGMSLGAIMEGSGLLKTPQ